MIYKQILNSFKIGTEFFFLTLYLENAVLSAYHNSEKIYNTFKTNLYIRT